MEIFEQSPAGIIQRKGSKVKGDGSARDDVVRAVRIEDKKRYKRRIGNSKRYVVESFFLRSRVGLEST